MTDSLSRYNSKIEQLMSGVRLVLMDIDGTLISGHNQSIENVSRQLKRLTHHGIRFSFATGRTIYGAMNEIEALTKLPRSRRRGVSRTPPMITYNGAVVVGGRGETVIDRRLINTNVFGELIEECFMWGAEPLVYLCHQNIMGGDIIEEVLASPQTVKYLPVEFNGMHVTPITDLSKIEKDIAAVLVINTTTPKPLDDLATKLQTKFINKLRVTSSGGRHIEISDINGTKLEAMNRLAQLEGIQTSAIMAIGDNYNDIDILKGAGIGIAVSNAPEPVKQAADFVSNHEVADGVSESLQMLIKAVSISRKEKKLGIHLGV